MVRHYKVKSDPLVGHPAAIAVLAEKIVFLEMLGCKIQNPLLGLSFGHVGISVNKK